ncbi:MAG TPA: M56/M15 family metallopeptidase [Puia sp.]|nr:M56/M15 family metallopeptidase [Puia sp.]
MSTMPVCLLQVIFLPAAMVLYGMKVILISGLLYGYYRVCLRSGSFHAFNRCYLLGSSVISIVLPFIDVPVQGFAAGGGAPSPGVLHAITTGHWEEAVAPSAASDGWRVLFTGLNPGAIIYVGVLFFFAVGLVRSLRYIRRLSRNYPVMRTMGADPLPCPERGESLDGWGKIQFYMTDEPGTPFSFFRKIFWNRELDLAGAQGQQILRHEWYHVRQGHTADILYLEMLRIVFWCNPFFHLILREIKATHEFLADRYAASGSDQYAYAELLVWQTIGHHHPAITNSFFNTHLKRRITMLTQSKNNRPGYLSRLLILPLLFLLFCAFAVRLSRKDVQSGAPLPSKALTVVIDAGHGGFDPGTISKSGINEKDLALSIAKKIKQFSGDYNINVLMTRDEDIMPGGKPTKKEGLRYRAQFAGEQHADLFVSVHVNNAPDTARGMQVYLSSANVDFQKSSMLGSVMIEAMKNTFVTHRLLQREENIYVLQAVKMPAILIECGNLSSPGDLSFITAEQNQETVAKNILQGIVLYQQTLGAAPSGAKNATTKKETGLVNR